MAKVKKIFKFTYILFILSLLFVTSSFANSFNIQDLYLNNEEEFLLQINNDVNINFIYSKKYKQLANVIAKQIKGTHYVYENLLGSPKDFKLTIKLTYHKRSRKVWISFDKVTYKVFDIFQ